MMDIKKILTHIDGVEGKKKRHMQLNEAASMIINGDNADDVGIILDRIKGVSSPTAPAPQGNSMRGDMDKFLSVMGPREPVDMNMGMGDDLPALANSPDEKYADVSAVTTKAGGGLNGPKNPKDIRVKDPSPYQDMEEWGNEPAEEVSDHDTMLNDLSGGINRKKQMFKPAAKGDNPMSVESIKERLLKALAEANSKPDFLDMDKDGNKKEPMKKAVADKKKKVDEVSKKLVRNYITKAVGDNVTRKKAVANADPDDQDKMQSKIDQRSASISKASKVHTDKHRKSLGIGTKQGDVSVKEAAKPDFLDMDKDGNKKEPMKKAVADKGKMPPQFKKK